MQDHWKYPEPAPGVVGAFDRFFGPGSTRAELALSIGAGLAAALALVLYAQTKGLGWNTPQTLIAIFLSADLTGGVVANATTAAKRWYHRKGQGFKQLFGFVAMHGVHPALVAWFFRDLDWLYFLVMYGYLLLAALLILRVKLYLQRPVALLLFCGAILLNQYAFTSTPGLEWFVPVLFLKLIVSHLLREEPYPQE
jgi:hypothetical protein